MIPDAALPAVSFWFLIAYLVTLLGALIYTVRMYRKGQYAEKGGRILRVCLIPQGCVIAIHGILFLHYGTAGFGHLKQKLAQDAASGDFSLHRLLWQLGVIWALPLVLLGVAAWLRRERIRASYGFALLSLLSVPLLVFCAGFAR